MSFRDPSPGYTRDRVTEERISNQFDALNTLLRQLNEVRDHLGFEQTENRTFSESGNAEVVRVRSTGRSFTTSTATATSVGNTTAQWNADQIQGVPVEEELSAGYLYYDGTSFSTTSISSTTSSVVAGVYELDSRLVLDGRLVII